jgi:RNA polymerase sigma-70 factor (ECF subfamily)
VKGGVEMIKSLSARGEEKEVQDMDRPSQNIEELYERHKKMVYRVSFSYLKNTEDTKDAVSEIFLKFMQNKIIFKTAEHEKAWLLRTTINFCKDFLKNWRRKNVNIDDYANIEGTNPFKDDEVLKAVMNLPDKYKYVVHLHYYEGYTSEEISKILKKPQSTILYHLQEARKFLKGVLENEE